MSITFFAYGSIIASGVLYLITLSAIKRIINKEDYSGHGFFGFILVCFIVYSLIILLGH